MRILDRYLLRQFLQVFFICFLSLTGLYVVIDAFQHLDQFDQFANYSQESGSLWQVMTQYYAYHAIAFFDQTSGILALIAAMFAITWLQRHNEMTALEAAGIRRLRIVKPILLAVVAISLFSAVNRETVIPRCRDELARDARDLAGTKPQPVRPRHDRQTGIRLTGKQLTIADRRVEEPVFTLPRSLAQYGPKLSANAALYEAATDDHPAGYLLQGVRAPVRLADRPSLSLDEWTVVFTPRDNTWLADNECFVRSGVDFELLADSPTRKRFASTAEMVRSLHNPSTDFGADVRVAVHTRLVQPLMDTTLLMLGVPLVLSRTNRNVFLAIGLCLAIVAVFMITAITCNYLGTSSLVSPALSAWLPLIIFVPVAAAMAEPLRQ